MGLVTGMGGTYLLTTGFAPRGTGTGGGQPGAPAPHINPVFVADQLLNVWILSVTLSIASGIFPAWKAARLSPLEALRR